MNSVDFIAVKRDGGEHSADDIRAFVAGVTEGSVPDYQAAAWLMAAYIRGMTRRETLDLTLAMRDSGARVDLSHLPNAPAVDKHSTGGVGDKTTLIVAPILAAAGVPVLKMSGRGLGYSGGTVDKLESIPGFRTGLTIAEALSIVKGGGAALIAQSSELAPADKVLYGLRDVTATIECIPLIAASIMSKKLAAGGQRIVLDVKCGRGAFMKTPEQARALARELVDISCGAGVPTRAVLSQMDEPLGVAVGNALEVEEALDMLESAGVYHAPSGSALAYRQLCLELAAHGLEAAGKADTLETARALAERMITSGQAAVSFAAISAAQGGPATVHEIRQSLPRAEHRVPVTAEVGGTITALDAETIGKIAVELGAGRLKKTDAIDPAVGILLVAKTGDEVKPGDTLATVCLNTLAAAETMCERIKSAYTLSTNTPSEPVTNLVLDTLVP
jgi:pyrimidine-nucleoside phosphorylase